MKQEFLNFINSLMEANPELTNSLMTDNIRDYLKILKDEKDSKPDLTENGKTILSYLQNNQNVKLWKSKDLAEQLGISSRCVSGTMRKLTNDGFCEKIGQNPCVYCLSEKGKNYVIEGENE